jgi:hypothetical protein
VCRITLATAVAIGDDVTIDGTTQPRFGTAPENVCATESAPSSMRVEVVGPAGFLNAALSIPYASGAGSVIRGLSLGGGTPLSVTGAGPYRVQCSHVGVDAGGVAAFPVDSIAVDIEGNANGTIFGTDGDGVDDLAERNLFAAPFAHVFYINANSNLRIAGNYFGLGADGATPLGCGYGVYTRQSSYANLVGSDFDGVSDALERNVFGPCEYAVWFANNAAPAGAENVVAGNWIGVDAQGGAAPSAIGIGLDAAGPGHVVRYNRIENNPIGVSVVESAALGPDSVGNCFAGNTVALRHAGSAALVFERNWWGAADGPSGDFAGTGDPVDVTGSGSVDVTPFETEGCPAPEPGAAVAGAVAIAALARRAARVRTGGRRP